MLNDSSDALIVVAQLGGPHGVRGQVKLKSFCEPPEACFTYGPLKSRDGKFELQIESYKPHKKGFLIQTKPEQTREFWLDLGSVEMCVPKSAFPKPDAEEFYHSDLIDMLALDSGANPVGRIKEIVNFGAGDILVVTPLGSSGQELLVPFTQEAVPMVNSEQKTLTIAEPEIWVVE